MEPLTLSDARQPAIVARALADAVASGDPSPRVTFGATLVATLARDGSGWWLYLGRGVVMSPLPTVQAVATITAWAQGRES